MCVGVVCVISCLCAGAGVCPRVTGAALSGRVCARRVDRPSPAQGLSFALAVPGQRAVYTRDYWFSMPDHRLTDWDEPVHGLAWHPSGDYLVLLLGAPGGRVLVRVWDVRRDAALAPDWPGWAAWPTGDVPHVAFGAGQCVLHHPYSAAGVVYSADWARYALVRVPGLSRIAIGPTGFGLGFGPGGVHVLDFNANRTAPGACTARHHAGAAPHTPAHHFARGVPAGACVRACAAAPGCYAVEHAPADGGVCKSFGLVPRGHGGHLVGLRQQLQPPRTGDGYTNYTCTLKGTVTPTPTRSGTGTATATPVPTPTPTATGSRSPSRTPTATGLPTVTPALPPCDPGGLGPLPIDRLLLDIAPAEPCLQGIDMGHGGSALRTAALEIRVERAAGRLHICAELPGDCPGLAGAVCSSAPCAARGVGVGGRGVRGAETVKQHIPPHSAQPRHTDHWAPRTRKRHQQEHRPQRPTESSHPTQHAKGRTGDCPGPRKGTTTRRNVTWGGVGAGGPVPCSSW